ncbi:hypothetical protein PZA11_001644 [Diplocarpon coronariae]
MTFSYRQFSQILLAKSDLPVPNIYVHFWQSPRKGLMLTIDVLHRPTMPLAEINTSSEDAIAIDLRPAFAMLAELVGLSVYCDLDVDEPLSNFDVSNPISCYMVSNTSSGHVSSVTLLRS